MPLAEIPVRNAKPTDPTYALMGATMPPKVESYSAIVDEKRPG